MTGPGARRWHPLLDALEVAVPVALHTMRGWSEAERRCAAEEAGDLVSEDGDHLLYGGPHCRTTFAAFARALAALAHAPGGVTFAGRHWCVRPDHSGCPKEHPRERQDP